MPGGGTARGHVHCAACGQRTRWGGNPHRPFCSLSCRLIDLGVWLDERYRIAAEPLGESAGDDGERPANRA